jgi:hypothetical protein
MHERFRKNVDLRLRSKLLRAGTARTAVQLRSFEFRVSIRIERCLH